MKDIRNNNKTKGVGMPRVASMLVYMSTGYDGESMTARSSRVVVIVRQSRA